VASEQEVFRLILQPSQQESILQLDHFRLVRIETPIRSSEQITKTLGHSLTSPQQQIPTEIALGKSRTAAMIAFYENSKRAKILREKPKKSNCTFLSLLYLI
jgi:hypothetical protein